MLMAAEHMLLLTRQKSGELCTCLNGFPHHDHRQENNLSLDQTENSEEPTVRRRGQPLKVVDHVCIFQIRQKDAELQFKFHSINEVNCFCPPTL